MVQARRARLCNQLCIDAFYRSAMINLQRALRNLGILRRDLAMHELLSDHERLNLEDVERKLRDELSTLGACRRGRRSATFRARKAIGSR